MVTNVLHVLGFVAVFALMVLAHRYRMRWKAAITPALREAVTLQEPTAPNVTPPAPAPAKPSVDMVTLRLLSEKGREIARTTIPRKARRPTLLYRHQGQLQNFVAERGEGQQFTYRRVGRETER